MRNTLIEAQRPRQERAQPLQYALPKLTNTPKTSISKTQFQTNPKKHNQYILPGMDAFGYVACTGTNFCLRARALAAVGWFPTYTITEGECVVVGGGHYYV